MAIARLGTIVGFVDLSDRLASLDEIDQEAGQIPGLDQRQRPLGGSGMTPLARAMRNSSSISRSPLP